MNHITLNEILTNIILTHSNSYTKNPTYGNNHQITKKKEINLEKTLAQMDMLLPTEMKEPAKEAIRACKDVRKYITIVCVFL